MGYNLSVFTDASLHLSTSYDFLHSLFLMDAFHIQIFPSLLPFWQAFPHKNPTHVENPSLLMQSQANTLPWLALSSAQCFPSSPLPPLWESSFGLGLYIFCICRAAGSRRSLEKLRQRFSWGSPGRKPTSTHPQASFGMSLQPGSWQGDWGFSQPLSFRSGNWSAVHTTIKQEARLQIIDLPLRFTVQD